MLSQRILEICNLKSAKYDFPTFKFVNFANFIQVAICSVHIDLIALWLSDEAASSIILQVPVQDPCLTWT